MLPIVVGMAEGLRITETTYPAKFARSGNRYYIAVPALVIERMRLTEGDHLDVTLNIPKYGEMDLEDRESKEITLKETD